MKAFLQKLKPKKPLIKLILYFCIPITILAFAYDIYLQQTSPEYLDYSPEKIIYSDGNQDCSHGDDCEGKCIFRCSYIDGEQVVSDTGICQKDSFASARYDYSFSKDEKCTIFEYYNESFE